MLAFIVYCMLLFGQFSVWATEVEKPRVGRRVMVCLPDPVANSSLAPYPRPDAPPLYRIVYGHNHNSEPLFFDLFGTLHFLPPQAYMTFNEMRELTETYRFAISESGPSSLSHAWLCWHAYAAGEKAFQGCDELKITPASLRLFEDMLAECHRDKEKVWYKQVKVNGELRVIETSSNQVLEFFQKEGGLEGWARRVYSSGEVPMHPVAKRDLLADKVALSLQVDLCRWGVDWCLTELLEQKGVNVSPLDIPNQLHLEPEEEKTHVEQATLCEIAESMRDLDNTKKYCEVLRKEMQDSWCVAIQDAYKKLVLGEEVEQTAEDLRELAPRHNLWVPLLQHYIQSSKGLPFLVFVGQDHIKDILRRLARQRIKLQGNPNLYSYDALYAYSYVRGNWKPYAKVIRNWAIYP